MAQVFGTEEISRNGTGYRSKLTDYSDSIIRLTVMDQKCKINKEEQNIESVKGIKKVSG